MMQEIAMGAGSEQKHHKHPQIPTKAIVNLDWIEYKSCRTDILLYTFGPSFTYFLVRNKSRHLAVCIEIVEQLARVMQAEGGVDFLLEGVLALFAEIFIKVMQEEEKGTFDHDVLFVPGMHLIRTLFQSRSNHTNALGIVDTIASGPLTAALRGALEAVIIT